MFLDGKRKRVSAIRKKLINKVCPRCSQRIKWAWVIRYESPGFVRLVYLCHRCEGVIRTEEEKHKLTACAPPASFFTRLV